MNDPAAHKNPNVRKPTLKVVLERLDGSQVDDNRFADIQSHVRTACSRYLDLSVSYTKQTPSAQEAYIGYAESLAPELSYCDETGWKAVMMARTFIDGKTRRGRDATAGGGGSSGSSRPRRGAGGSKRKDGSGSPSEEPSAANEDEEDISTEQLPLTPGQDHPGLGQSSGQGPNKRRRFPAAHPDLTSPEDFPVVSDLGYSSFARRTLKCMCSIYHSLRLTLRCRLDIRRVEPSSTLRASTLASVVLYFLCLNVCREHRMYPALLLE